MMERTQFLVEISSLTFILVLAAVVLLVLLVRRRPRSSQEAFEEARSAHGRLDGIQVDIVDARHERGILARAVEEIKNRVTWLMHKDIGEALDEEREREQAKKDAKPP